MITTRGSDLAVVGPLARAMTLAGAIALLLPGCRCGELTPLPLTSPCPPELVVGAVAPASEPIPIPIPCPRPVDPAQLLARSADARAAALRAELRDDPSSVDSYYASAAYASLALSNLADPTGREGRCARDLHNRSLADALRLAGRYGRIDPRARWLVNGPHGTMDVPVMHRGFVWKADDFQRLADPSEARANQYQKTCHRRDGLGAAQVVVRQNACAEPRDQFLPPVSFFPATAVLRPDPVTWLGLPGRPAGQDVLELSDSRRLQTVELGARTMPLAADPDAAISMAENAVGGQRYTWAGFLNPTVELSLAQVGLMEPYQPGKVVVVFVHGLLDNPYVFSDAVADLGGRPGFLDHYQVAVFRYPTGNSFLRSAAIFRRQLRALAATYDPAGTDPGMQNLVLVGYSMGGLLSKLQITSSGDALWATAANVPLDSLVAPDSSKALLRDIFYFEPVTNVRRVIYIATPHDGSDVATRFVGRLGSRVVQRPADARRIVEQITRDNPGAVKPIGEVIPSSIDLLARRGSLLQAMQSLAVNPVVTYHTIAGTGLGPERCARGDLVVPLNSAIIPGAASTLPVRATHFSIYHIADTINEVERILHEHSQSLGLPAP